MPDHLSKAEIEAGTHFITYVDVVRVVPGKPRAHAIDVLRVTVKAQSPEDSATQAIKHLQTFRGDNDHG